MDRDSRPGSRLRETVVSVVVGAVFLLRGTLMEASAKGLTRWEISDFPRGDTA